MILETIGIIFLGVIMIVMIVNQQLMMKNLREKQRRAEIKYNDNDFLNKYFVDIPDAKWIWDGTNSQSVSWLCLRKKVSLDAVPQKVKVYIAADSKYKLWINGETVVVEGGLKRGPTYNTTYCDIFELDPALFATGENLIALQVWHYVKNGFSHVGSGKAGVIFRFEIDDRVLCSDTDVKVKREYAYCAGMEGYDFKPNYRLSEPDIFYDARIANDGFFYQSYDDSGWSNAVIMGESGCEPWGRLYRRPIPMFAFGNVEMLSDGVESRVGKTRKIVYKLPKNRQFNAWFELAGAGGEHVVHYTDTYKIDLEYSFKHVYLTKAGKQTYEHPIWMSGGELTLEVPDGVTIINVGYRPVGYACEPSSVFECSDGAIVKLWNKAVNTLEVNMHDAYTDCPDRERAQWLGDAVNSSEQSFCCQDRRAADLMKKCFESLAGWQYADGTFLTVVPTTINTFELPDQNLAGICGMYNYYLNTGDKDTLELCCGMAADYLKMWKMKKNGIPVYRKDSWDWPDWGLKPDKKLIQFIWYYMALSSAEAMAEELGRLPELGWLRERRRLMQTNFTLLFGRKKGYSSGLLFDDRANGLAVVSGLADERIFAGDDNVLFTVRNSSPYMERYVLQALCKLGRYDLAIKRMKERYAKEIEDDKTTLSELFSQFRGSINHAWSGGVLTVMTRDILGIRPTAPGYAQYVVQPQTELFDHISHSVDTPRGRINIDISHPYGKTKVVLKCDFDGGKVTLPVDIPPRNDVCACNREIVDGNAVYEITAAGEYVWGEDGSGESKA